MKWYGYLGFFMIWVALLFSIIYLVLERNGKPVPCSSFMMNDSVQVRCFEYIIKKGVER